MTHINQKIIYILSVTAGLTSNQIAHKLQSYSSNEVQKALDSGVKTGLYHLTCTQSKNVCGPITQKRQYFLNHAAPFDNPQNKVYFSHMNSAFFGVTQHKPCTQIKGSSAPIY